MVEFVFLAMEVFLNSSMLNYQLAICNDLFLPCAMRYALCSMRFWEVGVVSGDESPIHLHRGMPPSTPLEWWDGLV